MNIPGELEIDERRGVIYFHANNGITRLRVCRLPKPIPLDSDTLLDITHMIGCNWGDKNKGDENGEEAGE